jgi:hypothetical protein
MDTLLPIFDIKTVFADSKESNLPPPKGIQVEISVYKAGSQQSLATALTNPEGYAGLFVPFSDPKQEYELRLKHPNYNSLGLKKIQLSSGIIKVVRVQLGKRCSNAPAKEIIDEVSVEGLQ